MLDIHPVTLAQLELSGYPFYPNSPQGLWETYSGKGGAY
jgi:hypothetical protein